ncbi:MAG: sugar phosphate isomerase/epimerase [Clostridia bacterium]|nr:sugar phosphate isomerase/epimerase [Clostridia bacterium]
MKATDWKLGVSSCFLKSLERDAFEEYVKNNVPLMEVSLDWNKYADIKWKELRANAEATGVELWSFHLPFEPFEENNIASPDKTVLKNTLALQSEYIKKAAEAGCKVIVIHPSAEPNPDNEKAERIKICKESLAELCELCEKCGVTLAAENLPRTCIGNNSAEIKELLRADSRLRVCFDTNHLLAEDCKDFIEAVGDKIITTHISDYDFMNERHWLPYEGKLDWVKLVTALQDVGYTGPFMYETSYKAPPSITRRDLTLEDMYKNYLACVNKEKAEVIGTPNLDVCRERAYYTTPFIG